MEFIERTTAPSKTNKYYISTKYKGYDRAMVIDKKTGSCLPNCCGLVHARWLESQKQTNYKKYDKLCTGNAKNYYGYTKDGYKRGKIPKIGAVGVYSGGSKGYGHVVFVEHVYKNGDFLSSNSAYGGSRFFTKKILKSTGYSFGSKYKLLGFIYSPIEFGKDVPKDTKKYYVVKKGDTLSSIAKKYKTTWKNLYKLNKTLIDNDAKKNGIKKNFYNHVYIGQNLRVK